MEAMMRVWRSAVPAFVGWQILLLVTSAQAQEPAAGAANPGRELVASKCFQCTADEIKSMADYLGDALGPNAKPIGPAK
jgi:hypothetical protein